MGRRKTHSPARDEAVLRVLGLGQTRPSRPELVDAGPTKAHVRRLIAAGWGVRTIARAADIHPDVVRNLLGTGRFPSRRVEVRTRDNVLALDPRVRP